MKKDTSAVPFTSYQKFVVFLLAITNFTVILDFMVMSPLGDMLMKQMSLETKQFGLAVSAYAISAGISGILTAGFADRFDRKKLLLFFYVGFIVGTALCAFANTYWLLIGARIVTGIFGGVIGSVGMAIVTDLFDIHHRGRVMGFVQMGLGVSQVMGIPISLYLANHWGWQAPFIMVAILGALVALLILAKLQPVAQHLHAKSDKDPLTHLWHTIARREYRMGYMATILLSIGGFMMMPFGSAFAINNLGLTNDQLPVLFMCAGVGTLIVMPIVGRISDKVDKFRLFAGASLYMMVMVVIYTHLGVTPLWLVITLNILLMAGIMSRMIPAGALGSALPGVADRGAYMSISTSVQQISGGVAAAFAGLIVQQKDKYSPLQHYDTLGYIMVAITFIAIFMMYRVDVMIKNRVHEQKL